MSATLKGTYTYDSSPDLTTQYSLEGSVHLDPFTGGLVLSTRSYEPLLVNHLPSLLILRGYCEAAIAMQREKDK